MKTKIPVKSNIKEYLRWGICVLSATGMVLLLFVRLLEASATCDYCGARSQTGTWCEECGRDVHSTLRCPECKNYVSKRTVYCDRCGAYIKDSVKDQKTEGYSDRLYQSKRRTSSYE